jgi:hypothetical protein
MGIPTHLIPVQSRCDKVVCQLGDDVLDELFAHLATTASLLAESINEDADLVGFLSPAQ